LAYKDLTGLPTLAAPVSNETGGKQEEPAMAATSTRSAQDHPHSKPMPEAPMPCRRNARIEMDQREADLDAELREMLNEVAISR
jgi:hypothetical protein